jgi:hypothetical protein
MSAICQLENEAHMDPIHGQRDNLEKEKALDLLNHCIRSKWPKVKQNYTHIF